MLISLLHLLTDEKMVYTGTELSYTITKLKERTEYAFQLRAFTDDDEESFVSEEVKIKTFRASKYNQGYLR